MRHGMHLVVLLLMVALFLVTAPAGGQESVGLPTYSEGDFWAYDLILPASVVPGNLTAEFNVTGNSTVTIQGSEMRNIRGTDRSVYEATHALRVGASAKVPFVLFNQTTNITFTALVSANETAYVGTGGLEVWERHTEFSLSVSDPLDLFSIEANGTIDMALNYTTNDWGFPLTVGNTGVEAFNATGASFVRFPVFNITDPFNVTYNSTSVPLALNGSTSFEALRAETVPVPKGTFATVVVASKPSEAGAMIPTNASVLAYWSSVVGAPVRYAAINETEDVQIEFVLTDYRYQAAGFSILGLPPEFAIPLLVGIAAVAVILVIVLGRLRRPAMPPPPPPPGP